VRLFPVIDRWEERSPEGNTAREGRKRNAGKKGRKKH
jgi:hypothetical protein